MTTLYTTLGPYSRDKLGLILPHEHVFTDLGPIEEENWRDAEAAPVVEQVTPMLERARDAEITALVECTPEGVGRRVDIVRAVSEATGFPVVVATGVYQEPSIPDWVREASEDELYEWMIEELTEGIDGTGVRAAWIKVSTDDDDPNGLSDDEAKILRAAARAGAETGAVIGSHTLHADVVHQQLDLIEDAGYTAEQFIWIHSQAEEVDDHEAVAERGAWIEYDWIGGDDQDDDRYVDLLQHMLDAGYEGQLLLSQDRGWYDPSQPEGGEFKEYTYLVEEFLPKLRGTGVDEATIEQLTRDNPFDAYAR
jgi:phosphotriesterase-related protein